MNGRPRHGSVVLIMLALTAMVGVVLIGHALPAAADSPTPCPLGNSNCVGVGVGVGPGGPGSGGGSSPPPPPGGGGVVAEPATCSGYPGPYRGVCLSGRGNGTLPPCLDLYSQYRSQLDPVALNAFLAANGCPTLPPAAVGGAPPPSPAALARQAAASFVLPSPAAGRYPAGRLQSGQPYTVVRADTWIWADASTWRSYTARASLGVVWAAVTATPTLLSFTPGDGRPAVSCRGPGSVWRSGVNGPWDSSPSGCQYQYQHSTINDPNQQLTATYTITWQLTWTGSGNTSGTLTAKTTTATATFAVAEAESVVTR